MRLVLLTKFIAQDLEALLMFYMGSRGVAGNDRSSSGL